MKTRIVVELEVNDSGIAFVERPEQAFLECNVSPPTPERPTPQVDIQGNEEGLRWLAEKVLAVANARPAGYHVHLDEEEGLSGGAELIVAQTPRRSRR